MIYLYSGTPGSYKSFHAVREAVKHLKKGYNVIANFPISYSNVIKKPISGEYRFLTNQDLTVSYLYDFARDYHIRSVNSQTLVIIDEASIKFNSRNFAAVDRMEWINFLANHRHFNYDFIIVAQSDKMIDKQIRCLIETEYRFRSIRNYKLLGRLLDLIFRGVYIVVDMWYPSQLKNCVRWFHFNRRVADCYDTMALFVGRQTESDNSIMVRYGAKIIGAVRYPEVRSDMIAFKNGKIKFCTRFSSLIVNNVNRLYSDISFDYVCCVPSSANKLKSRGYNPAELLATNVAEALNIPFVNSLEKNVENKLQKELSASQRIQNVKNVFTPAVPVSGNVLLIDDICTTGATLAEASRTLESSYNCTVYCASVAFT